MRKLLLSLVLTVIVSAVGAQEKYAVASDIPYVDPADTSVYRKERCRLDICYPTEQKGCKTIVWFHGGGLEGGNKELLPELKNRGMIVVDPNYRLYPRCQAPDYVDDAAAAVAWVVKNIAQYGGDPSQVYVGGHSAGGYLALMLALDKNYLAKYGMDADSIKGYFPVSGQTATHYTIRKERGISVTLPVVDRLAPLNNARVLGTGLVLITGDRRLEMMARYEENLYLKAVLEGVGNASVPLHELSGFDHGTVLAPAALLIRDILVRDKD